MPILVRTLLFTLFIPGSVVGLVPWWILRETRGADALALGLLAPLGFALIAVGPLVYLPCARDFLRVGRGTPFPLDPPREFVATGLYRWTRNPMYVGFAATLAGEALAFGSWPLALWAASMVLVWHLFVVFHEEPDLRRRFGASYERYCAEVPRWIPRPRHESRP